MEQHGHVGTQVARAAESERHLPVEALPVRAAVELLRGHVQDDDDGREAGEEDASRPRQARAAEEEKGRHRKDECDPDPDPEGGRPGEQEAAPEARLGQRDVSAVGHPARHVQEDHQQNARGDDVAVDRVPAERSLCEWAHPPGGCTEAGEAVAERAEHAEQQGDVGEVGCQDHPEIPRGMWAEEGVAQREEGVAQDTEMAPVRREQPAHEGVVDDVLEVEEVVGVKVVVDDRMIDESGQEEGEDEVRGGQWLQGRSRRRPGATRCGGVGSATCAPG